MTGSYARLMLVGFGVVMVASLAIAAAPVTWHIAGYESNARFSAVPDNPRTTDGQFADVRPILAFAPFGSPAVPSRPGAPAKTAEGLILRGVFIASDRRSTALIATESGGTNVYEVGQTIADGTVLEEILPSNVVVQVGGHRETLSFPKKTTASNARVARSTLPNGVQGFAAEAQPLPAPGKPAAPEETIDLYRKQIAANPQTVMNNLGITATPQGYRIGQNMASELGRTGLRPGDVVMRVNGAEVGNVERDRQLFDQIAAAGNARVEVLRDGRIIIMTFPLR